MDHNRCRKTGRRLARVLQILEMLNDANGEADEEYQSYISEAWEVVRELLDPPQEVSPVPRTDDVLPNRSAGATCMAGSVHSLTAGFRPRRGALAYMTVDRQATPDRGSAIRQSTQRPEPRNTATPPPAYEWASMWSPPGPTGPPPSYKEATEQVINGRNYVDVRRQEDPVWPSQQVKFHGRIIGF